MTSLSTFPIFPILPLELQLKIWLHAVHSIPPRLIDLNALYLTHSHVPLSPLLHATHDSRTAFLRHYKPWGSYITAYADLRTDTAILLLDSTSSQFSYAYVDFDVDTFVLGFELIDGKTYTDLNRVFYSERIREIRHVAVMMEDYIFVMQTAVGQIEKAREFPRKEKVEAFGSVMCMQSLTVAVGGERKGRGRLVEYEGDSMRGLIDYNMTAYTAREVLEKIGEERDGWRVPDMRVASLVADD